MEANLPSMLIIMTHPIGALRADVLGRADLSQLFIF